MTYPSIATVEDFENRIAPNTVAGDELPRVESLLSYASALVRRSTGASFVDDAGELLDDQKTADARDVVVSMLERAIVNPAGVVQETAGPFSVSFGPAAADRIYLTKADKVILGAFRYKGALQTISTSRGPVETFAGTETLVDDDLAEIVP